MELISEVVVVDTYEVGSVAQLAQALTALLQCLPEGAEVPLSMNYGISLLQGRDRHGALAYEIQMRAAKNQPGIKAAIQARTGSANNARAIGDESA